MPATAAAAAGGGGGGAAVTALTTAMAAAAPPTVLRVSHSVLTVCGAEGFALYDLTSMQVTHRCTRLGPVAQVALMDGVNMAAVLRHGRRHVVLVDLDADSDMTDLYFDMEVKNVLVNAKRLVVVHEEFAHMYDVQTMRPLPQVRTNSPPNVDGVAALSALSYDACYLAIPQSSDATDTMRGDVLLIDTLACNRVVVVCAHRTRVTQIVFSQEGNCFATCSTNGNVIRVFSAAGVFMHSFKRGTTPAKIAGLALSGDGAIAACASSSGTLHLFDAQEAHTAKEKEARSFSKTDIAKGATAAGTSMCVSPTGRNVWLVEVGGGSAAGSTSASAAAAGGGGKGRKKKGGAAVVVRDVAGAEPAAPAAAAAGGPAGRVTRYVIDGRRTKVELETVVPSLAATASPSAPAPSSRATTAK